MADTTKECECSALLLLSRMSTAYNIWIDNMPRAERYFAPLIDDMVNHLHAQLEKPGNEELADEMKNTVAKIDQQVFDSAVGKLTYVRAVETLRNSLHQNPRLRQTFLCGQPAPSGAETPLSMEVFKALEILENGEPTDAKEAFDRIYTEQTCGV